MTTAEELASVADDAPPAVLRNPFGKGESIFLHFSPAHIDATRETFIDFLADLAHEAGAPTVSVRRPDGTRLSNVDVAPFRHGTVLYCGVIDGVIPARGNTRTPIGLPPATEQDVVITFPSRDHLYEVRAHDYLGSTDRTEVTLKQATALLFAQLPYRIEGVTATARAATRGQGALLDISVQTDGASPADHACVIDVQDADGHRRDALRATVLCPGGKARHMVPIALNDPVGDWLLTVTETVSGATAEVQVEVR